MVVHDATGVRVAFGRIVPRSLDVSAFAPYTGYKGSLMVSGEMDVHGDGVADSAAQDLKWFLKGVDPACNRAPPEGVANACGIHIHEGFNCENAQGHYYNTTEDPWKSVVYKDGSGHYGPIVTDTTMYDVLGRTFVIHDYQGARVACGIIQPKAEVVPSIGKYGTYDGALQVSGDVRITVADGDFFAAQRLSWNLTGVDPMCAEPVVADAPANACGIHIHEGPDCTDAGGHYYNPELSEDPWKHVTYGTVSGRSEGKDVVVVTGENMYDVNGRPFVVHDHLGARVGCGFISIQD